VIIVTIDIPPGSLPVVDELLSLPPDEGFDDVMALVLLLVWLCD
jgi:hypothetical protein